MEQLEKNYNDLHYCAKESLNFPLVFHQLNVDAQNFLRDFYDEIVYYNDTRNKELVQDLDLIKNDLEAVIADIKK